MHVISLNYFCELFMHSHLLIFSRKQIMNSRLMRRHEAAEFNLNCSIFFIAIAKGAMADSDSSEDGKISKEEMARLKKKMYDARNKKKAGGLSTCGGVTNKIELERLQRVAIDAEVSACCSGLHHNQHYCKYHHHLPSLGSSP